LLGLNKLLRDISGSVFVEAAVVMPLFFLLALGTVDVSYMFYEWSLANKAAYVGARTAVVSNPVASNVANVSYTAAELQRLGQLCFNTANGNATNPVNCPSVSAVCVSSSASCGTGNTYSSTAFTHILTAMQGVFPRIAASNVEITYSTANLGNLGFVGQPWAGSSDFTNPQYTLPMNVTVCIGCDQATPMTHQFFFVQGLLRFFGGAISATPTIPAFSTTLPSESIYTQ
jgi:Flp pilus assembly protein TadG